MTLHPAIQFDIDCEIETMFSQSVAYRTLDQMKAHRRAYIWTEKDILSTTGKYHDHKSVLEFDGDSHLMLEAAYGPGFTTGIHQAALASDDILDVKIEHEDWEIYLRNMAVFFGSDPYGVNENAD